MCRKESRVFYQSGPGSPCWVTERQSVPSAARLFDVRQLYHIVARIQLNNISLITVLEISAQGV
jgi:hypothetical protein